MGGSIGKDFTCPYMPEISEPSKVFTVMEMVTGRNQINKLGR